MPECPRCGKRNDAPVTRWTGGAKMSRPMKVQRFVCKSCGTSFVAWTDPKTGKTRAMARKA